MDFELSETYLRLYRSKNDLNFFIQENLPKGLYNVLIERTKCPPAPFPVKESK